MTLQKILDNRKKSAPKNRNKYSGREEATRSTKPKARRKFSFSWITSIFSVASMVTVCAILFVAVAISLIFVYRYFTTSEYFALKNIDVSGTNNLTYTEVLAESGIESGINCLAISIDDIEGRLIKNPWVEEISVKRSLPDGLVIKIKEREAKFWTLQNGTMHYTDRVGDIIGPLETDKFLALPLLEIASDSAHVASEIEPTLHSLEAVINALPEDFRQPSLYKITQARGVEVYIEGKRLRLSLGLEDIEGNVKRVALVLDDLIQRGELNQVGEVRAHGNKVWVIDSGS